MEFVLRQESAEREAFRQARISAKRWNRSICISRAAAEIRVFIRSTLLVVLCDDLGRVLRIDQDHVGASDLEPSQAFTY